MRIQVRLFAVLAERAGCGSIEVELPEGRPVTVGELKRLASEQLPALGELGFASGVVGTRYVSDETELSAGDEVALLPPVSGGEEPLEAGVFELASEPFDVAALSARVAHPSCGAVLSFLGTTRDRNRGESVERLDYEAFEAMAGPEMRRIFTRCLERFGPASATGDQAPDERRLRMLCVHRTGTVPVGQGSVLIVVASPHRDAAFDAARFLIDELKQSLPVWKKEHYQDGHHWIGDRS